MATSRWAYRLVTDPKHFIFRQGRQRLRGRCNRVNCRTIRRGWHKKDKTLARCCPTGGSSQLFFDLQSSVSDDPLPTCMQMQGPASRQTAAPLARGGRCSGKRSGSHVIRLIATASAGRRYLHQPAESATCAVALLFLVVGGAGKWRIRRRRILVFASRPSRKRQILHGVRVIGLNPSMETASGVESAGTRCQRGCRFEQPAANI